MYAAALLALVSAASTLGSPTPRADAPQPRLERRLTTSGAVPSFVLQYAPIVYLSSLEEYWPSDLQTHLNHLSPLFNGTTAVPSAPSPLQLSTLNASVINQTVYLTSQPGDVTANFTADYLYSDYGKPDANGKSAAATPIIMADKSDLVAPGVLDVFYFEFYSYNWGPQVLGEHFGNHVGDWEYTMIRFVNGTPSAMFFSAHSGGEVYTWAPIEKENGRPVVYSAVGSHANYATFGGHNITDGVPLSFVQDQTDKGTRWDQSLNYIAYWYQGGQAASDFTPATGTTTPYEWLATYTYWGDKQYPESDPRQLDILGFARFGDGPTGPIDKSLSRTNVSWDATVTTATVLPAIQNVTSQSQAAALARGSATYGVSLPSPVLLLSLVVAPALSAAMVLTRTL